MNLPDIPLWLHDVTIEAALYHLHCGDITRDQYNAFFVIWFNSPSPRFAEDLN